MSLRYWFFPVKSGDFRLEILTEDACRLTVEDPIISDYQMLQPFIQTLSDMNWIRKGNTIVKPKGLTVIDIKAPMSLVGPLLVGQVHRNGDTWTGIRSTAGRVVVNDGADVSLKNLPVVSQASEPSKTPEIEKKPEEAVAAVTLQPPGRGCPAPTACQRRASQVLRTFCADEQWASWQNNGWMSVVGHETGVKYRLYHRNEAAARGFGHVLVAPRASDVTYARSWGGVPPREVCVWHRDVPPEEEALAIKFAVEHRERWLLEPDRQGRLST